MAEGTKPSSILGPLDDPHEPADDNFYRNLTIAFMVGMVFLFGLFTLMLILLARAG
jgi:hypothetical protein